MSSHVPLRSIALSLAITGGLLLGSCAGSAKRSTTDPVVEVVTQIDAYRAGGFHPIDKTISTDPTYLALGDRVTTAGVQFSGPIARITLNDVLLATLRNNRDIRIEDYNRSIAEDAIAAAKGIYDLLLQASWNYTNTDQQTPVRVNPDSPRNGLLVSKNRQHTTSIALSQLFPTGGILELFASRFYSNTRGTATTIGAINPYNSVAFGVSLAQPLLRGFGPYVTNAPIRIARLNQQIARENFYNTVITDLSNAIKTYWDLVFTINNYEVQRLSLERAQELLRVAVIKRDTGVEPPNTVLQAQAEVARRDAQVIDARRAIADTQDALKRIMNISEQSDEWQYNLIPLDKPTFAPVSLNEEAVYREAMQMRSDYRAARFNADVLEINRRVAKNQRLPQLNLTGSYQATGLEKPLGGAIDNAETVDFETWNAGVQLSYPLQNRAARAQYRQSVSQVDQQKERVKDFEDLIRLDVRTAIRALETDLKLINAFDSSVKAEEANLDSQRKRYEVGFATIFEVIQFQENLATAQVNYIQSIINYNKAMAELQRVKGSLLGNYYIEILDKPAQAAPETPKPADKRAAEKPTVEKPAVAKPVGEKPAAEKPAAQKASAGKPAIAH